MPRPGAPRRLAPIALLTTAGIALAGCASSEATAEGGDAAVVRLALNNTSSSLAAVVAEEEGFFEKHGIDIETQVLADITKIPPALGNQFDVGFGVQPLVINGAARGLDTVVVSGNGWSSTDSTDMLIVVPEDSDIRTLADLEGRTLAAPTLTGNLHYATLYKLREEGVDPASVEQVQVATPAMLDQLEAGVIDAAEVQQPFITLAEESGMRVLAYTLDSVSDPAGMSVWVSSRGWADANEETIMAFRDAVDDATAWMAENEQETKQILADFTGQDIELVEKAPIPHYDSHYTVEDLAVWDEVLRSVAGFEGEVDYDSLVAYPSDAE
jgi:NitT/TauT family transport system substrate-binding protein